MSEEIVTWVELCGVTMAGAVEPDAGLIWSGLEGWWGLPDARSDGDAIPGGHGRFRRARLLRDSRVITLTGHIYTGSSAELHAVRDRLEAALADGVGVMRVATAAGGIWEREVEIDTLTIDPDRGRRWTRFVIDMLAPDPRRYGPVQRVGPARLPSSTGGVRLPQAMPWNFGSTSDESRLIVPNAGRIDLAPTLIIEGGFESVQVVDVTAGTVLAYDRPVPEGAVLRLDCGARRSTVGGVVTSRWLTRREWVTIRPGTVHELRFDAAGASGVPRMWAEYREGAW